LKRLDDLAAASAGTDATMARRIGVFAPHGLLETIYSAAIHLGKYDVAADAARRHDSLPLGQASDPELHEALRQVELARALVGQGKRVEVQATLEPTLAMLRGRVSTGTATLSLRQGCAEALYAAALAQGDDPAGRATRRRLLDEASALLAGVSAEARQLRSLRQLSDEIAAARDS